jgi:hypothetical protein
MTGEEQGHEAVEGEDREAFERHRRAFIGELAPVGAVETTLAERIARLSWRLKQAEWLQNEALNNLIEKEMSNPLVKLAESLLAEGVDLMGDDPETNPDLAVGRAVAKDFSGERVIERLSIYEEQVQNRLFKAMDDLRRLQQERKS